MRIVAMVRALTGCGRVGFDALDAALRTSEAGAGATDAPSTLGIQPLARYRFAGDLHDDFGHPDLVPQSAGTFGPDGYHFTACAGLKFTGLAPQDRYTIDLEFSLASLQSWRKLVDYEALDVDEGLYTLDRALQFVVLSQVKYATSPSVDFTPDLVRRATLTRDASKHVVGYVDGAMVFEFDDGSNVARESTNTMWFFTDDVTTGNECDAGVVRRIELFDVALDATQVPQI